jgi:hypothetical protein
MFPLKQTQKTDQLIDMQRNIAEQKSAIHKSGCEVLIEGMSVSQ